MCNSYIQNSISFSKEGLIFLLEAKWNIGQSSLWSRHCGFQALRWLIHLWSSPSLGASSKFVQGTRVTQLKADHVSWNSCSAVSGHHCFIPWYYETARFSAWFVSIWAAAFCLVSQPFSQHAGSFSCGKCLYHSLFLRSLGPSSPGCFSRFELYFLSPQPGQMAASPGLQLSVWPLGISFCIGKFPEEKKEINSSEYRAPRSVGLLFSRILVPRIPAVWMPPSCCFFYCVCCCFVIVVVYLKVHSPARRTVLNENSSDINSTRARNKSQIHLTKFIINV